jgi:hypothetical protein
MRRVEQIQVVPPVCVGAMSRDPGMTPISLRSRRRDAMRRSTKLLLCVRCGRARPPPCFCRGRSGEGVAPPVLKSVIRSYKSGDLQRFRSGVVRSDGVRSANLGTRLGTQTGVRPLDVDPMCVSLALAARGCGPDFGRAATKIRPRTLGMGGDYGSVASHPALVGGRTPQTWRFSS